jgi:hypothetical protein
VGIDAREVVVQRLLLFDASRDARGAEGHVGEREGEYARREGRGYRERVVGGSLVLHCEVDHHDVVRDRLVRYRSPTPLGIEEDDVLCHAIERDSVFVDAIP